MAIKQPEILSRADFDEAVVKLRLNVSEIAKETGIPRTYISEFRNGDRKLRPEHLAKLRDYFEDKGVEFESEPKTKLAEDTDTPTGSPHPSLSVGTVCYFPIRGDLPADRVRDVLAEIDGNDKRIAELLARRTTRKAAFIGDSEEYSEATQDDIRELFARLSANYVLFRYLTGINNPLAAPVEKDTLQEILVDTVRESVERAGVNGDEDDPDKTPEDESAEGGK